MPGPRPGLPRTGAPTKASLSDLRHGRRHRPVHGCPRNRNPGSTRDDAERWTSAFKDNFSGWKEIKIPFASMTRKEIGNGAPNDGFGLTEVTAGVSARWAQAREVLLPGRSVGLRHRADQAADGRLQHAQLRGHRRRYGNCHGQAQQALSEYGNGPLRDNVRSRDPEPRLHTGRWHANLPRQRHPAVVHGADDRRRKVSGRARRTGRAVQPDRRPGNGHPADRPSEHPRRRDTTRHCSTTSRPTRTCGQRTGQLPCPTRRSPPRIDWRCPARAPTNTCSRSARRPASIFR